MTMTCRIDWYKHQIHKKQYWKKVITFIYILDKVYYTIIFRLLTKYLKCTWKKNWYWCILITRYMVRWCGINIVFVSVLCGKFCVIVTYNFYNTEYSYYNKRFSKSVWVYMHVVCECVRWPYLYYSCTINLKKEQTVKRLCLIFYFSKINTM